MNTESQPTIVDAYHFLTAAYFADISSYRKLAAEFGIDSTMLKELMEHPFTASFHTFLSELEEHTLQDLHLDCELRRGRRLKRRK